MKKIIIIPNKNSYIFKYIKSGSDKIFNVYKNTNPNILMRIWRKLIYFIGLGCFNRYYDDWTSYLNDDVQFIVFDSCRPYHRLQRKLRKAKRQPIIYYWNPICHQDNIRQLRKYFKIYSYSLQDAQRYELNYNPQFFVNIPIERYAIDEFDGIFIGRNKSRLKTLERVYRYFDHPFFYVVKDGNENSKILKLYDKQISYLDYIQLLSKSKSIVEILFSDNADFSLRTMEALFYQKKLITNNRFILQTPFYNDNNIYILNESTTKNDIQAFLEKPFVLYKEEYINYYEFNSWVERFNQ